MKHGGKPRPRRALPAFLLLSLGAACMAAPVDHTPPPGEVPTGGVCLPVERIDHVDVPEDRTMLFVMKDRTVWRNELADVCPGLHFDGFAHAPTVNLVCGNKQTIGVLRSGATCALGAFLLLPPAEADRQNNSQ